VPFLRDLNLANEGFSLHFKLMLDNDIDLYTESQYLFDIGSLYGGHVQCYILKGLVCCEVIFNKKQWKVSLHNKNFIRKHFKNTTYPPL